MVKRIVEKDVARRVKTVNDKLPFKEAGDTKVRRPISMHGKQRAWIINGLRHLKAPTVIATLVALIFAVPGLDFERPIDRLETFAGCMSVTKGEWEEGRKAVPFDVTYSSDMDLLSAQGFANALYHACNVLPGSGSMSAPVCSTFVIASRGSTHRSPTNPLGRQDSESVRQGTILANRALVILFILAAKGCWTILEQPASSCMEHLPLFQYFLRLVPQVKMFMRMGDHGGPTPKPTLLYSSHACIAGLNDFRTMPQHRNREITVRYTNRAGEKRWHGGKDMKGSQSYPRQFGVSLARLRTLHEKRNKRKAVRFLRAARRTTNDFDTRVRINKAWTDGADLSSVISYLSQK